MSRQFSNSKANNGRRSYTSSSAISGGFRGSQNLSSICLTGAGKSGGYSSISHYNLGQSRRLSGGSHSGYGTGFRDFSGLGYGTGPFPYSIGPVSFGAGTGKPRGFSSQSVGAHSQAGDYGNHSNGCTDGYRQDGFSSQSLGGSYSRCYRLAGFGSRSLGGGAWGYEQLGRFGEGRGIHTVRINTNLLQPLGIQVDPEISRVKEEETEQIKSLNDKFAGFIDKVRHLEQHNKLLETKWNCLQQQEPIERQNIEHFFENYIAGLRRQLQLLLNEREQLLVEQAKFQEVVSEFKSSYEDEINRRMAAENDFVLLKKDVDVSYTSKVDLQVKVEALRQELNFLQCVYGAELENLQMACSETNVIVSMDNSRILDMEGIINSVRSQYEEIAQRSKDEVNALYEDKYKELQNTWGQYCNSLSSGHNEIQDLTRVIQRYKAETETAKKQIEVLQSSIADSEQRGDSALKDARSKLFEVESALQGSKDELARLLRDYQELLNVKLALDIEIAMYKSLLEGEEIRISNSMPVNISVVGCPNISITGGRTYGGPIGGPGIGRRGVYSPGQSYTQRNTSSSGKISTKSGKLTGKTGFSSRSGGTLSRCSISSGFGQWGTTLVPSSPRDSVSANAGGPGGGDYGPRSRGWSNKSGGHAANTTLKSTTTGSSVGHNYNNQSSGGDGFSGRY